VNTGELIKNGKMEEFNGNIPEEWTTATPAEISRETAGGRVHTGESAVAVSNGGNLSQTVPVHEGCTYLLSFYALGGGEQVGLTAAVTFIGGGIGLEITIRPQDMPNSNNNYGYYRGITIPVPAGAAAAEITFTATAADGQYVSIDDVSFSVQ
jgi:hypothetical protein